MDEQSERVIKAMEALDTVGMLYDADEFDAVDIELVVRCLITAISKLVVDVESLKEQQECAGVGT